MSAIIEDARTPLVSEIATSKRRLSPPDAPDSEPPAKRVKPDTPSVTPKASSGSPDVQPENASTARDKKRRKKKKRKQSVVAAAQKVAGEDDGQKAADVRDSSPPAPTVKPKSVSRSPQEAPVIRTDPPAAQSKPATRTYASRGVETDAPASPPKADKGKARAVTPSPAIEPIAGPSSSSPVEAATATTETFARYQALLSTLLPSLTCQICLLLMHRPFALSPCGHIACHSCLTSWFQNGTDAVNAVPVFPIAPAPQAAPNTVANDRHANGPADADVNANADVPVPPPAPAPAPRAPPARAALPKKKTCPHCRAVVRERPIEVWSLKEMVLSVAKSGLADAESVPLELQPSTSTASAAAHAPGVSDDPWHGIFAPIRKVHPVFDPYDDDYDDYDDMPLEWLELAPGMGDPGRMGIRDDEDGGVYRCVGCMHEIWDGECTHCGRLYPGHRARGRGSAPPGYGRDEDDEDGVVDEAAIEAVAAAQLAAAALDFDEFGDSDDSEGDPWDRMRQRRLRDEMYDVVDAHADEAEDDLVDVGSHGGDDEDEDDEYGGSFIDDGSDDEVVELPAPYGRRAAPIVISDDDDDEAVDAPAPARRGARRGVTRVVSDDEDDANDDENQVPQDVDDLAQIVAAREREMYGDDGSIPARGYHPHGHMGESEDEDAAEEDRDYDSAASDEYEAHNPYLARLDRPWQFQAELTEDDDEGEDLY